LKAIEEIFGKQFLASEALAVSSSVFPGDVLPFWYSRCDYEALFADGKLGSIAQHHLSFVQPVLPFTERCGKGAAADHLERLFWSEVSQSNGCTGRFKKSFTTLKPCIHLFRGHMQCFELS
jgi:hypothetical protein